MVYIRTKKVKGVQYLYLVKSKWDSKNKTSKQEIVKYLGKASDVVNDDIPVEYRDNPKVLSVLAAQNPQDIKKREEATEKSIKSLYKKLTDGDINNCVQIYDDYVKIFNTADFFDKILKPVMYRIGDEWANNKISIATEHVASNVAQTLVKIIMDKETTSGNKKKILICVPLGEEHHLGCDVIETFLTGKGYKVFNMATSIPSDSILYFIEHNNPDVVMVSITLEDNLKTGQRLIKKIKDNFDVPIMVGGYALEQDKIPKFEANIFANSTLNELPKMIRSTIT
jgi:methanogenic corrinoid protein MtbC1